MYVFVQENSQYQIINQILCQLIQRLFFLYLQIICYIFDISQQMNWGQPTGQSQGWNNQPQQQSLFNPNQYYTLTTGLSKKFVLDVSLSTKHGNKYKMIIYEKNGGQNQKFRFQLQSNGKYLILVKIAGKQFTVEVPNNSSKDGEQILIGQRDNLINQFWNFERAQATQQNAFFISTSNGKYLDVFEERDKNDQPVIQWSKTGKPNQIWYANPA